MNGVSPKLNVHSVWELVDRAGKSPSETSTAPLTNSEIQTNITSTGSKTQTNKALTKKTHAPKKHVTKHPRVTNKGTHVPKKHT